jgi:hypothetical protein
VVELRFCKDPETGLPHIFDHGVIENEVQEVLSRPGEEHPGSDESRIRLGQTQAGRYLQVIYVPDAVGDGAFVDTAYDMTSKARKRTADVNGGEGNEQEERATVSSGLERGAGPETGGALRQSNRR